MQFAIVNGQRLEAFPRGKGICPICGSVVIAKCGPRNINHWAHYRLKDCDPWWENETAWHREWKNRFPEECREVSHIASDGEIHRADVKTPTGIVIEFQHSTIADAERTSREEFYGNLIWVLDGTGFKKNFDIYHKLPDPRSVLAGDIVWSKAQRHMNGSNHGLFFRLSEAREDNPTITKAEVRSGWIHSIVDIQRELELSYNGYHQFDWVRPRQTWLDAKRPVYIDFGDEHLVRLDIYDDSGLKCVRLISKQKFIDDVTAETDANNIGSCFGPVQS